METNNHKINDYSAVLDQRYGKVGTPEREVFNEEAYRFYTGQMLLDARREAKITQAELASKLNVNKSYISRVENGIINPSASMFYRIVSALGFRVEIVRPLYG